MILAGGEGTRLRPYTSVLPKPLMPIGDAPVLEIIIRQLARDGFDHITLAVNYHAALIKAFFGDGQAWGVTLDYSLETRPLGTIGPLRLIADLPDHFLLLNGDVLTDLSFREFYEAHRAGDRFFTVAAAERTHTIDYGVLHLGGTDRLVNFSEKPVSQYLVSMGVYGVSRRVLDHVPDAKFGFDDLMHDSLRHGHAVNVHVHSGYWLDIGRPDDYVRASEEFEAMRTALFKNA